MTGRITHWLMEAHRLAIDPKTSEAILRALQLVRRMHHDHYLNRRKTPMTAAVLLIVPACSPRHGPTAPSSTDYGDRR